MSDNSLAVVAIGFFDGVHLGHRRILAGATKAITFDRHPRALLEPARAPRLLQTLAERVAAIKACGVREVVVLKFTPELAATEPRAVPAALGLESGCTVRCGANWRFGRGAAGDAALLRSLGYAVEVVPYAEVDGERVSSSRVRAQLAAGDLEAAEAMLARPFVASGAVGAGKGEGAKLAFPTINVQLREDFPELPLGVYEARVEGRVALANYGCAPTFGERAWKVPVLEVHFPGLAADDAWLRAHSVSGRPLAVELRRFLRPERKFPSPAALAEQIACDLRALAAPPPPSSPLLSVVITTRNEEANIAACIDSFANFRDRVEVIVVDNQSTDRTKALAAEHGAMVLDRGPERSAQRNLGWQTARSSWVIVLDADMILPPETIEEILSVARAATPDTLAYWVPEVRTGSGWRVKVRNFERSFYDGTCVDALRLFHRSVLEQTGGYDEQLIAGPEDWELDIRVLATGAKCAVLKHHLFHNEKRLTYRMMLKKKAYYTRSFAAYQSKWKGHPAVKRQFSPWYRFVGVFVEKGKWRKILRHPLLFAGVLFERFSVGLVYFFNR